MASHSYFLFPKDVHWNSYLCEERLSALHPFFVGQNTWYIRLLMRSPYSFYFSKNPASFVTLSDHAHGRHACHVHREGCSNPPPLNVMTIFVKHLLIYLIIQLHHLLNKSVQSHYPYRSHLAVLASSENE